MEVIQIYDKDKLVSTLEVDYLTKYVKLTNHVIIDGMNWLFMPFGRITDVTWDDFDAFVKTRCFPYERPNRKTLLKLWGVDEYDPHKIVRKTHAVMNDDFLWFKYENETITFEDVRMR